MPHQREIAASLIAHLKHCQSILKEIECPIDCYPCENPVRLSGCGHQFNAAAIGEWVSSGSASCPLCRQTHDVSISQDKITENILRISALCDAEQYDLALAHMRQYFQPYLKTWQKHTIAPIHWMLHRSGHARPFVGYNPKASSANDPIVCNLDEPTLALLASSVKWVHTHKKELEPKPCQVSTPKKEPATAISSTRSTLAITTISCIKTRVSEQALIQSQAAINFKALKSCQDFYTETSSIRKNINSVFSLDTIENPVRLKQCHHLFDHQDIERWKDYSTHHTCPTCRRPGLNAYVDPTFSTIEAAHQAMEKQHFIQAYDLLKKQFGDCLKQYNAHHTEADYDFIINKSGHVVFSNRKSKYLALADETKAILRHTMTFLNKTNTDNIFHCEILAIYLSQTEQQQLSMTTTAIETCLAANNTLNKPDFWLQKTPEDCKVLINNLAEVYDHILESNHTSKYKQLLTGYLRHQAQNMLHFMLKHAMIPEKPTFIEEQCLNRKLFVQHRISAKPISWFFKTNTHKKIQSEKKHYTQATARLFDRPKLKKLNIAPTEVDTPICK